LDDKTVIEEQFKLPNICKNSFRATPNGKSKILGKNTTQRKRTNGLDAIF
jgi:hypothetical protein